MKHSILFFLAALCALTPTWAADAPSADNPDRQVQPGVPQGKITSGVFSNSQIFPGTRRDYSVYEAVNFWWRVVLGARLG